MWMSLLSGFSNHMNEDDYNGDGDEIVKDIYKEIRLLPMLCEDGFVCLPEPVLIPKEIETMPWPWSNGGRQEMSVHGTPTPGILPSS